MGKPVVVVVDELDGVLAAAAEAEEAENMLKVRGEGSCCAEGSDGPTLLC